MTRRTALPAPTRRGLDREEAAAYVGVSASKFDQLVAARTMPRPRRIDSRRVWDVRQLDLAFDALPVENGAEGAPASTPAPGNTWADIHKH